MGALRRHGCEAPLHPSQIAVVGIALLSVAVFYVLSAHELPQFMRRTVVPLFSLQFAVTAVLFVLISRFDPGQPTLQATHPTASNEATDELRLAVPITTVTTLEMKAIAGLLASHPVVATCPDCGRVALTADTRHCGRCNKCIPGYDHHCIYLNTCIGTCNYPLFVGLLSCSILLLFTQQIVSGYAISSLLGPGQGADRKARAVVLCVLSILPLLELFFLLVLGTFHLYIALRGLTTYEWLYQWLERRHPERTGTSVVVAATEGSRTPL